MHARRLPDGRLLVPMRAEGPNGEIGDGMVVIDSTHPDYQKWDDEAAGGPSWSDLEQQ